MSSEVYPITSEQVIAAGVLISGTALITWAYLRRYRNNVFRQTEKTSIMGGDGPMSSEMKAVMDRNSSTRLHEKNITDY